MATYKIASSTAHISLLFLAFLFTHTPLLYSDCQTALEHAHAIRAEALQKVAESRVDAHTKVWLAHVDDAEFQKFTVVLANFERLLIDRNTKNLSPFAQAFIANSTGRKALARATGTNVSHFLLSYSETELGKYLLGGVLFRIFYFPEAASSSQSILVFKNRVGELAEFVYRLERMQELSLEQVPAKQEAFQLFLDSHFRYYALEGEFEERLLSTNIKAADLSRKIRERISLDTGELATTTSPLFNLASLINNFSEPIAPDWIRLYPIDRFWEFYVSFHRRSNFKYFEQEIYALFAAIPISEVGFKVEYSHDLINSLEAFNLVFLNRAKEEDRHYFLVNVNYNLPKVIRALSEDGKSYEVSERYMTYEDYKILVKWCQLTELDTPTFRFFSN